MPVQSVLFKRSYWNLPALGYWIAAHGYHIKKIDVTQNLYRVRQYDPKPRAKYHMVKLPNHIMLVISNK
jgi:hypothetical protein